MKKSQLDKVREILMQERKISRNTCIDTRLTVRLSSYINQLKKEGYGISGAKMGNDFIYYLFGAPKTLQTEVIRNELGNIIQVIEVYK